MSDELAKRTVLDNEIDANKQMVKACLATSLLIIGIFICYCFKVFPLNNYTLIYIFMPINILIMLSPIIWQRTKFIEKSSFKYFLFILLVYVVATINVIVPKHGILAWGLPILLANHYYSRKFSTIVFIGAAITMFFCVYLGMFFGEYDPNLLTSGLIIDGEKYQPDYPLERFDMLHTLLEQGDNRYVKAFAFYFLPRVLILFIFFLASQGLNRRTFNLLKQESESRIQNDRMSSELKIAAKIQESALPKGTFSNSEISIVAGIHPAREIGGDLYDYHFLDKYHLVFMIGDVSGKGAPAALFMMRAITSFKDAISLDKSPAEILKEVNKSLMEGNDGLMFVTCFFGILDTRNGEIRYCNAGHCPPLISKNGKFEYLKCSSGFVLGTFDDIPLKDEVATIEPGQIFTLYTDGITEAKNAKGEYYGSNRLLESMNNSRYFTLNELGKEMVDNIRSFTAGYEQSDDLTALSFHYLYDNIDWEEIELDSTKENVTKALDFVSNNCKKNGVNDKLIKNFRIAVDEIYSNISKYAYGDNIGKVFIRYCYFKNTDEIKLTFIDKGAPYDPTKREMPDTTVIEKEGGLGILIVKTIMDDVEYDRRNDKNFLVLTKHVK